MYVRVIIFYGECSGQKLFIGTDKIEFSYLSSVVMKSAIGNSVVGEQMLLEKWGWNIFEKTTLRFMERQIRL